jgi:outer membrane murein-binding lipoprotein Lpp
MSEIDRATQKLHYWRAEYSILNADIKDMERRLSRMRKDRRAARAGIARAEATTLRLTRAGKKEYNTP